MKKKLTKKRFSGRGEWISIEEMFKRAKDFFLMLCAVEMLLTDAVEKFLIAVRKNNQVGYERSWGF